MKSQWLQRRCKVEEHGDWVVSEQPCLQAGARNNGIIPATLLIHCLLW
jgi:hypothetical protein